MCDFTIMEKALKIAWIYRIQSNSSAAWKFIPDHILRHHGNLTFLTNCNYDVKSLKLENLPVFYRSILEYWQNFKTLDDNNSDIKQEILWNNCNILIDKKPIFYRNWFAQGIVYLHHLQNEHGLFYNLTEFKIKYNLNVPFTDYYGLLDAIPRAWKNELKLCNHTDIVNENSETLLSTASIYSTFLQNSFKPPTSQSKILRHGFTESNVQKVYQLPFIITKEIKIIMFQYKIIHNILPTQMSLYRDGLSDNDICLLCNTEKQTLNHLLVNCLKTTSFWKLFEDWWYGKSQERLSLTQSNILYGFFGKTTHWQALNYSIIIGKHYIFCTNGDQDELCFRTFLLRLHDKLQILRESAIASKCLHKFQRTWAFLL